MLYLTENQAYSVWKMIERSWESLYNFLYTDYYQDQKTGLDRELEYKLMQIAGKFKDTRIQFPQTYNQFYEVTNQLLQQG